MLLVRKNAQEKVASLLLELARRVGTDETRSSFRLPISRQEMADHLGLSIETVGRTMTRLREDGLIALPTPTTSSSSAPRSCRRSPKVLRSGEGFPPGHRHRAGAPSSDGCGHGRQGRGALAGTVTVVLAAARYAGLRRLLGPLSAGRCAAAAGNRCDLWRGHPDPGGRGKAIWTSRQPPGRVGAALMDCQG